MDTHLFQALTLGLLLIVVVVLLVIVSMLGKVRAALDDRRAARTTGDAAEATTASDLVDRGVLDATSESTRAAFDAFEAEESQDALAPAAEDLPVETAAESEAAADAPVATTAAETVDEFDEGDSERPFERGGRWYFRRGGELLVYEEGTGEWIPSAGIEDQPAVSASEPVASENEALAHTEEVAASTEPEPEPQPEPEPAADSTQHTSSTSFGGQPVPVVDDPAAFEEGDAAPAPADAATDFEVSEAREEEALAQQSESFWKCPSCGAVNGSTATSCRMCFTPRP